MVSSRTKRLRVVYAVTTVLFLALQSWSVWQYLTEAPRMTDTITELGYPIYFMKILAVAKLLGVLAIATGLSPTLKEWAYAGFTFDVCGAFASHVSRGDSLIVALVPLAFLAAQLASYYCWKQMGVRRASRRRRYAFDADRRELAQSTA
ncbi:MAG: DoxX family protein [Myxococcales bacterium]|nr:MAG: DoxX family protein [Myxococcales bacterium]